MKCFYTIQGLDSNSQEETDIDPGASSSDNQQRDGDNDEVCKEEFFNILLTCLFLTRTHE